MRAYWSKKEIDALTQLLQAGVPLFKIVRVFKGRSEAAIRSKSRSLGFDIPKNIMEIDMDELKRLIKGA